MSAERGARAQGRVLTPEEVIRQQLLDRMREGWDLGGEKFDRDALHER